MAQLVLKNISKNFGDIEALKDLSLNVTDGEFLVLLGPSGAGKTTTLKIIAGIEQPNEGLVYFDDRLMNSVEPQKRNVAMAFESYALYPHYTVADNLASPLRAPGNRINKAEVTRRVQQTAELLNIHMLLDRLPGQLSNGQKQRVSLGRAMIREPDILLLDEPISHLDAKLRHRMRTEFKALESDIQTTTVYVTHDYLEALSLADRVAVLNEGVLHQVGKPREIFNEPADIFCSTILGEPRINLIDCAVARSNGVLTLQSDQDGLNIAVPSHVAARIEEQNLDEVILGVRPLHLDVGNGQTPESGSHSHLSGSVYIYERLGTKGVLTLQAVGQQINVITPIEMGFQIDENVTVKFDPNDALYFDPHTQKNIFG